MRTGKANINDESYIKFAIESKKSTFERYKKLQLYCLNNTHITADGNIMYDYDVPEMNKEIALAEREFISSSAYLANLLENK